MPIYNFKCQACDCLQDRLLKSFDELKDYHTICDNCGSEDMKKTLEGMTFSHRTGCKNSKAFVKSEIKRGLAMRQELKEKYLVEKFQPLRGQGLESVYNNVKENGSKVREDMIRQMEANSSRADARQNEWKEGAKKRFSKKKKEIIERKKKESGS